MSPAAGSAFASAGSKRGCGAAEWIDAAACVPPYNARMRLIAAALACVLALIGGGPALAQTSPAEKPVTKSKAATQKPAAQQPVAQKAKPAASQVVMPDAEKIVLLLRTTLITLNDAIQTGNFTVIRDMAAPGFRDANTTGRLAQSFSDLASKGIDLSPTSVIAPQLTEPPGLDQAKGMLRLKGYFPGQPVQINFEMLFQAVDGRWRLFGLSVQPGPTVAAQSAPAAQNAPQSGPAQ